MTTYFSDRVVWLTGASSGIGEALTYELVKKGCRVIISARRKEELERVLGNCDAAFQGNVRILPIDLSDAATLELCTAAAVQLFGVVDTVILNAGVSQRSLAKDTTLEVDRRIMEVDYFGTVALTKFLIPHFLQREKGHIVVVSSVMGKFGTPFRSSYAAAKHALHGFYDSLRAELWKESKNIKVTVICPGWVKTNITQHALTGNGSPLREMDNATAKGMTPDLFAKKMLRAVEKEINEKYIGGSKELMAVGLKRFLPALFARVVRSAKVR